jgi:hypothetical protein
MKWVAIKDKLPEERKCVLVYFPKHEPEFTYRVMYLRLNDCSNQIMQHCKRCSYHWVSPDGGSQNCLDVFPSHWAELEGPKE